MKTSPWSAYCFVHGHAVCFLAIQDIFVWGNYSTGRMQRVNNVPQHVCSKLERWSSKSCVTRSKTNNAFLISAVNEAVGLGWLEYNSYQSRPNFHVHLWEAPNRKEFNRTKPCKCKLGNSEDLDLRVRELKTLAAEQGLLKLSRKS